MKKIILAMLFSVFLLSAMTVPSLSQELTVGVNVGDWFLYEDTLVEYEADPGVPFPPDEFHIFLKTYNESDWRNVTVTDVSETTITFEQVIHWKNGTEVTETFDVDIASPPYMHEDTMAIGANLTVGDEARPPNPGFGWPAIIINETIDTEYEDTTRETNYCDVNALGIVFHDLYYDKATGILVKKVSNMSQYSVAEGNAAWLYTTELILVSVWVIPEYPIWTVMLLVFVAVTVSINLYIRKKLRH